MSILNVNTIQPVGSGQTITVSATNISAPSTVVTASSFVGPLTGNVTGNVSGGSFSGISTAGITTAYIGSINDGPISGFRNLITNGEMVLDQRNVGAAVTVNADGFSSRQFPVDRFPVQRVGTIVITAQQDTVAPPNFQNSVKLTVTTADSSVAATDYAFINHRLEGYTASPLRYGTSAAKQATLSFWVRSSITGTYCIGISNYADNRAHVKEYTINSADTWEYKTITITGDTTGTWEKTNSGGMNIAWTLLSGSDYQATANTWHTSVKLATSNQTQWGSTSSATFYLTGVQLELGTTASIFERRSYGQELALCQRYCQRFRVFPTSSFDSFMAYYGGTNALSSVKRLTTPMRTTPIASFTNASVQYYSYAGSWTNTTLLASIIDEQMYYIYCSSDGDGRSKLMRNGGSGLDPDPIVTFSAEL